MSFASKCSLRASPASGLGGVYATALGENDPISTVALGPDVKNQQTVSSKGQTIHTPHTTHGACWQWGLVPSNSVENTYGIFSYQGGEDPSSFAWSSTDEGAVAGDPLILSNDTTKYINWHVKKFEAPNGVENAYT